MNGLDLKHFLPNVIEQFMPRFTDRNVVLYITIDARYTNSKDTSREVAIMRHVLIHRPSNYTKVLVSEDTDFLGLRDFKYCKSEEYFEKYSDHDSCWRSDGFRFLSDDYFKAAKEVGEEIPKDMHGFISLGLVGGMKFYELEKFEPVKDDDYTKGYVVKLKRRISMKEISSYMQDSDC
jgi:hypothetical protein